MKKKIFLLYLLLTATNTFAQENVSKEIDELQKRVETLEKESKNQKKLKISGFVQAQFQYGQESASLKVGSPNENSDQSFNRIGIRRGRLKFTYEENIMSAVFQLDMSKTGVGIKDVYLNIKDPWTKSNALRAGVFSRPFGFDLSNSSSKRETPEYSLIYQTLFPDESDLGAMLILQAPSKSAWSILKLEAGLFAGNGIKKETDNKKDFIGHLSLNKTLKNNFSFGVGVSYYYGHVYQGTEKVYTMQDDGFVVNNASTNRGGFAKREYVGFDAQLTLSSLLGKTRLQAEYLFGQQPGTENSNKSPNYSTLPENDLYIRPFNGGYITFVQDIGTLPFSVVFKYDWHDPNTKVSKDDVGLKETKKADIAKTSFGMGGLWRIINNLHLQAFYEINQNETTPFIDGMENDLKDNAFTLRLQYRF